MKLTRADTLGLLWGFAEATAFFIVPDVLLSWLALDSFKRAMVACVWALAGALLGGFSIWLLGRIDPETARTLFASLPAINASMIASVRSQLETSGLMSLFIGPLTGTPYKIYALEAGNLGIGLAIFLLVSVPARLIRFVLVSAAVGALSRLLENRLSLGRRRALLALAWCGFYAWYFYVMADKVQT